MVFMNRKQFTCCGVFCAHHALGVCWLVPYPAVYCLNFVLFFYGVCVSVLLIVIGNYRE